LENGDANREETSAVKSTARRVELHNPDGNAEIVKILDQTHQHHNHIENTKTKHRGPERACVHD
jgi:hypothetical protein